MLSAPQIIAAIEDGLGEHQPIQTRLRAAKLALEIEASVGDDDAVREREPIPAEQMTREELIGSILALAASPQQHGGFSGRWRVGDE